MLTQTKVLCGNYASQKPRINTVEHIGQLIFSIYIVESIVPIQDIWPHGPSSAAYKTACMPLTKAYEAENTP